MKYYIIAGEASGDLHASHLMHSLKKEDPEAEFRFIGGDLMTAEGGSRLRHFKEIAYMGFVPVLMHLKTILHARQQCKADIAEWKPDVVILVDYAGFNLNIAEFVHGLDFGGGRRPAVHYYIAPKIWAWKEGRIKQFRAFVDEMFCILPFEEEWFMNRHNYKVHYVGNPTVNEVLDFKASYRGNLDDFGVECSGDNRPIVALLAGSRRQEIKDNLPMMIAVARHFPQYQFVLACAPSVEKSVYDAYLQGSGIKRVYGQTYALLAHAVAAMVTSGTATLETACFGVPQVVLYKTPLPRVARFVWDNFFRVKWISLVNLIAGHEVVAEMMAEKFTEKDIARELEACLPGGEKYGSIIRGYEEMAQKLGNDVAPDNAARVIYSQLSEGM